MDSNKLKEKTISGFLFKFLERVGAVGIKLLITILLARLLLPEEYGIIALVTVVIAFLDVFVTYGFGNSLVVDSKSDSVDFSTCFFFGIALSIIVYIIFYFFAPSLAEWFSNSAGGELKYDVVLLTLVFRIMALRLPIAAANSVQHAFVQKNMIFKTFFYSTLIGTVISGIIAIVMAYLGFGVWALVEQYLGNVILDTIFLFIFTKWKPSLVFSFKRLKKIYNYGWKILAVGLIDTGYNELRSVLIAKQYSSSDLAYYNKGNEFPGTFNNFIEPTIDNVMFPALSKCNEDKERMKSLTRRAIKTSTYIIFPIMIGLFCIAEPLISILLTEKWIGSALFLQVFCLAYLFRPIQFINNSVIRASGKSGLLLIFDVLKKAIGIGLLLVCIWFGPIWVAISFTITSLISTIMNIFPNKMIIGYGYLEQIKDIFVNLLSALIMGFFVYLLSYLPFSNFFVLLIQIMAGAVIYILISVVLKNENLYYLISTAKGVLKKLKR